MFPHEWLMTKVLPTCGHKYFMTFFSSIVARASIEFTVQLYSVSLPYQVNLNLHLHKNLHVWILLCPLTKHLPNG